MKTAQFQVFTAQRFPSIDTFMKQADGSEIIIKQEGNMFAFYEGEKKLLESIWQTYAGHRIRNGKHKFLSAYQGRKFVFFQPREDGQHTFAKCFQAVSFHLHKTRTYFLLV
jgi:hypothetical protein